MLRRVHAAVLSTPSARFNARARRSPAWHWLCFWLLCACGSTDADGPIETLTRFLETMDRSNVNESSRKDAYAMLDETAQSALAERARRAALVTGRSFAPWDMLAPGRFRLRFAPAEHAGMRATVTGDHAVVHVKADDGKDKASVPMTRQGGRWRVQLAVPVVRRDREAALPRVPNP
jgi:hypothetical protein